MVQIETERSMVSRTQKSGAFYFSGELFIGFFSPFFIGQLRFFRPFSSRSPGYLASFVDRRWKHLLFSVVEICFGACVKLALEQTSFIFCYLSIPHKTLFIFCYLSRPHIRSFYWKKNVISSK